MRISLVCNTTGWMGTYMGHVAGGFRALGHQVTLIDYHNWDASSWTKFLKSQKILLKNRTLGLLSHLNEIKPDIVIFALAHLIFDFSLIRAQYSGIVVFFDMDGPALPCFRDDLNWIKKIDLLASVSNMTVNYLKGLGFSNILYWPHAVDTGFYRPLSLSTTDRQRFHSPLSFVGRPSKRRAELLQQLPTESLAIWGERWFRNTYVNDPKIKKALRLKSDILGEDLVKMYNASTVVLNILREPFAQKRTIMNLQVFSVPACGTCLLTEWVQELEQAFEPDTEILVFKDRSEFIEKANKYAFETKSAQKIGDAGRRRCLAHHTHKHRALELLKQL